MELREVLIGNDLERGFTDSRRSLLFIPAQSPRGGFISPRVVFAGRGPQETPFSALLQQVLPMHPTSTITVPIMRSEPPPVPAESTSLHYKDTMDAGTEIDEDEDAQWQESLVLSDPSSIPDAFICPITMSIMREPVVAQDGHTYEKSAIVRWLRVSERATSPKTNLEMGSLLIENRTLKNMIADFLAKQRGDSTESVPGDPSPS
jgi:hypothetical protein